MNETLRKYVASIGLFVCLLIIAEIILQNFPGLKYGVSKIWIGQDNCWGNCYSSDLNGYFPIVKKGQLFFEKTPYCISYDCQKRKAGYFPKRENEVAIIGDSFAFGEGVKEEDTLGYLLGMKFSKINFRNFGESAANIEGVFEVFTQVINGKKIKSIIYFYNLNDIIMSSALAKRQAYITDFQNIRMQNIKKSNNFVTDMLSKSVIYSLAQRAITLQRESRLTINHYLDMYFSDDNKKELTETINLLAMMNDIARKGGTDFYVVIYPLFYKDIFGRYPFLQIHGLLKKICNERGIQCIDTYPVFEKYHSLKRFIVHAADYHPNGLANRLIVDYLMEGRILTKKNGLD